MELEPLYQAFSYLPYVKEYPNREKKILKILIFWPMENCLYILHAPDQGQLTDLYKSWIQYISRVSGTGAMCQVKAEPQWRVLAIIKSVTTLWLQVYWYVGLHQITLLNLYYIMYIL